MKPKVKLWDVIEYSQSEGSQDQAKQQEQTNRGLVEISVGKVGRAVARDVVAQANGG